MPRLVLLSGFPGSGKDTVANHLANNHAFTHLKLAEPLWEMLNELGVKAYYEGFALRINDPMVREMGKGYETNLVRPLNFPSGPQRLSVREALIALGNTLRKRFGNDVLASRLRAAILNNHASDIVVSDVRTRGEAVDLRHWTRGRPGLSLGWNVHIGLVRPGHNQEGDLNEFAEMNCDHTIVNDGDVASLLAKVDDVVGLQRV